MRKERTVISRIYIRSFTAPQLASRGFGTFTGLGLVMPATSSASSWHVQERQVSCWELLHPSVASESSSYICSTTTHFLRRKYRHLCEVAERRNRALHVFTLDDNQRLVRTLTTYDRRIGNVHLHTVHNIFGSVLLESILRLVKPLQKLFPSPIALANGNSSSLSDLAVLGLLNFRIVEVVMSTS